MIEVKIYLFFSHKNYVITHFILLYSLSTSQNSMIYIHPCYELSSNQILNHLPMIQLMILNYFLMIIYAFNYNFIMIISFVLLLLVSFLYFIINFHPVNHLNYHLNYYQSIVSNIYLL
jgi:hypothetical protein